MEAFSTDQNVCASCMYWGGPRKTDRWSHSVFVESADVEGYCGEFCTEKEACNLCGSHVPLRR